jgi:16S rRNA (cytosine1402-N4)-methyltransferase
MQNDSSSDASPHSDEHLPVLLDEVIHYLNIEPAGVYIDATFGRGGHSKAILKRLGDAGRLLVMDKDPQAIKAALDLAASDHRCQVKHGSFTEMAQFAAEQQVTGQVSGILLDLGVSSPQLDDATRGFSFLRDGELDMRMNPAAGESAREWINRVSESEMADVFFRYGEERYSRRIARAIVDYRVKSPIRTTRELADIIAKAHPAWEKGKDPATRCFQAIRIFINNELDDLSACLQSSLALLKKGGRLVVISFHSLEDRIVKRFMQKAVKGDDYPAGLPITQDKMNIQLKKVAAAVRADAAELKRNPRARSAVLRVAEKVA